MLQAVPPWLAVMRSLDGTHAEGDNPAILAWPKFIATQYPEMAAYCAGYTHDSISWCGLTIAYCMAKAGIRPVFGPSDTDRFLWALAWKEFGDVVQKGSEQPGDVLVFVWASGGHHVTLYEGTDGGNYICHGGNQSHAVNQQHYSQAYCVGIRRPPAVAAMQQADPSMQQEGGFMQHPPLSMHEAAAPPALDLIGGVQAVVRQWVFAESGTTAKADRLRAALDTFDQAIATALTPVTQATAALRQALVEFEQPGAAPGTPGQTGAPAAPAASAVPAPTRILGGDGSFAFVAMVIGEDLVVRGVVATWFGGPNDPSDSGSTASGVSTLNNPNILGVSLPMDVGPKSPLTQGSPLPKIPWQTAVKVKNLMTGIEQSAPLIDLGPAKPPHAHAAIDLTEAFFRALGGDPNAGVMHVDYTIPGGARFLSATAT